ncbi:MAG: sigma-70 family RNA polymerase sigma factor [Nitrososphaerales archaeon]
MSNDTLEKPALDVLLDNDLHNLVQCTASQFFGFYGRRAVHSVMITQEDLATEGYVAVMVAYQSFNPNLGFTSNIVRWFRTHAYPYITNAMSTYCRKFGHALSISEKSSRSDLPNLVGIGIVHMDQLDEDQEFDLPVGSGVEISHDVDEFFLAGFSAFERKLVRDHMIDGYSLDEISKRYQLSKSRAGEILRGLTERMKTRAEDYVKDDHR